jgi:hypothetical protein
MATYTEMLSDINGLFTTSYWTGQNIPIYPDNYQGTISNPNEFLRLNILPATSEYASHGQGNRKELSGTIIISIYVKAGEGQARILTICDILDTLMQDKILTNKTNIGMSYTAMNGLDSANTSLYSANYIIPFKLYGD